MPTAAHCKAGGDAQRQCVTVGRHAAVAEHAAVHHFDQVQVDDTAHVAVDTRLGVEVEAAIERDLDVLDTGDRAAEHGDVSVAQERRAWQVHLRVLQHERRI